MLKLAADGAFIYKSRAASKQWRGYRQKKGEPVAVLTLLELLESKCTFCFHPSSTRHRSANAAMKQIVLLVRYKERLVAAPCSTTIFATPSYNSRCSLLRCRWVEKKKKKRKPSVGMYVGRTRLFKSVGLKELGNRRAQSSTV